MATEETLPKTCMTRESTHMLEKVFDFCSPLQKVLVMTSVEMVDRIFVEEACSC